MPRKEQVKIFDNAHGARSAEPGPSVRKVLIISTALLIAGFVIVYYLFFYTL